MQSELYMEQKGISFSTSSYELQLFIGMNYVMGYHRLPSIRDYWSTQPCLQGPYVSNVMPRKRFEQILATLPTFCQQLKYF